MPLRTFAFEPQRTTVLTESSGSGGIDSIGEVQMLGISLDAQSGEHALRRERKPRVTGSPPHRKLHWR